MKPARISIQDWKPLKRALGQVIENRRGYQSELAPHGEKMIDSFKSVGFINTGHTLKHDTYSATGLADSYYRDMYGISDWAYHRVKGALKKFLKVS